MDRRAVISGVGVALPGVVSTADLDAETPKIGVPVEPAERIGRRGLLYKDRATQLGLCAARDSLEAAGHLGEDGRVADGDRVGVIVSSNFGNVDTVCAVAEKIAAESVAATSPMDLPNASSNVIASSIAIRFGLRGPNLTLCNGGTSGLDALSWAARLIRGGRAERMVVVGVETTNHVVARLVNDAPAGRRLDGAAVVVVEDWGACMRRDAEALAELGAYARHPDVVGCVARLPLAEGRPPAVWFVPSRADVDTSIEGLEDVPRRDLAAVFGQASGALGVLQSAAAAMWLAGDGTRPALATTADAHAAAALLILPAGGAS